MFQTPKVLQLPTISRAVHQDGFGPGFALAVKRFDRHEENKAYSASRRKKMHTIGMRRANRSRF